MATHSRTRLRSWALTTTLYLPRDWLLARAGRGLVPLLMPGGEMPGGRGHPPSVRLRRGWGKEAER